MRNVESLLPQAVRLRDLLTTASRRKPRSDLDEGLVRLWKQELILLLATADRTGTELTEDTPQHEVCACMLGMAKRDLRCFGAAIDAVLKVRKDGTIAPSARTKARLRDEAERVLCKLEFIVTMAGVR